MKIRYTSSDKRLTFEFESPGVKEAFEDIAAVQEIFEQDVCGNPNCGSTNLRFSKRDIEGNGYYEVVCKDCDHKLAFGQRKVGGALFPKRVNTKTKKPIGTFGNGWHKYVSKEELED